MPETNMHYLRELEEIASAIRNAQNLEALRPLFYRLGEIASAAPGDIDVLASVGDRKREIAEAGARFGRPMAAAVAASAAPSASPAAPPLQDAGLLPTAMMPLPEAGATRPMPSRNYTPPAAVNWRIWAALGAAVAVLIAVGTWAGLRYFAPPSQATAAIDAKQPDQPPAAPPVAPAVNTAPAPAQSLSLQVALQRATISFDGASPIAAGAQPARFDNVAPGVHTVRLAAPDSEASFRFDAGEGKPPSVVGAVDARGATVVLVSHSAGAARLVTSAGSWQLSVNGRPEGEAGPAGIQLKHWKNGTNDFALGEGSAQIRFQAVSEQGPSLAAVVLPVPVSAMPAAGAAAPQRMAVIPPPPSQPKPVSLDEPPAAVKPASTPVPVAAVTPIASPPPPAPTPAPTPAKPAPAARKRGSVADFADSSAWRTEGDLTRSTRPGFHVFGATGAGVFQFDVLAEHGGKARWTAGYTDPNNYRLFEIDGETLSAYEVVKGARKRVARAPLAGSGEKRWRLRIDVSPASVTHAVQRAGAWTTLDTWSVPGRDLAAGRFGFLVQGQERIALSGFSFEPR